jgi:hypothetical protein
LEAVFAEENPFPGISGHTGSGFFLSSIRPCRTEAGLQKLDRRGEIMVVVPLSQPEMESNTADEARWSEKTNWATVAAAGSLVAGGLLLLTGNRKAGTVAAASGTTLLLLDQQDLLRTWWNAIPGHIENVQKLLGKVQDSVNVVSSQRDRLHKVFNR